MGAQSSSDSSVWGFSQTVVPCWNLRMAAVCVHIYLFDFLFFWRIFLEFLGREGGERKIRDCSVNFQPWALSQMRSAIPNFAFLERFFFFFFHFPQGREDFPTEPINTFCRNELFVLSVLKWRNPVWKHCLGSEIWDSVRGGALAAEGAETDTRG